MNDYKKPVYDEVTGICIQLCKVCGSQMQIIGMDHITGNYQFACTNYPTCKSTRTLGGKSGYNLDIPKPKGKQTNFHENRRKTWGIQ